MPAKYRSVCFTWNNWDDVDRIEEIFKEWSQVTYYVFGEEVGEQNGTPHLQGYVEFKDKVAKSTINNKLEKQHSEERFGSAKQAAAYCKKGEQSHAEWEKYGTAGPNYGLNARVKEGGEISNQGKRNDLDPAVEMIRSGKRMRTVAEEHPTTFVKYHKGLLALQAILVKPRSEAPEIKVFYGPTGSNKSRTAREWLGGEPEIDFYVWWPAQDKWFDGYEGHKQALFEEFRGQMRFGDILMLLDRYDARVQYKGGCIQFCATKIAITSPIHPKLWYRQEDLTKQDRIDQLIRRIGEENIIQMGECYTEENPRFVYEQ